LHPYLQQTQDAIDAAAAGLHPDRLTTHPGEGKWSAAEILEHLARAFKETVPGLEKCLERGATIAKPATLYQRMAALLVVQLQYLPSGRKAPQMTVPHGMDPDEIMATIHQSLASMDELFARCEQRFGDVKLMNHPVLGPLTAAEWRKFHWVHTRHHMKQVSALAQRALS